MSTIERTCADMDGISFHILEIVVMEEGFAKTSDVSAIRVRIENFLRQQ
jgi:hypothetical protein